MAAETDYRHVARCTTRHGRRGLVGLSWNEVRARAAAFAEEWKGAAHENGEKQSICNPGRLGSCSRCSQTRRLGSKVYLIPTQAKRNLSSRSGIGGVLSAT